ncbi:MAG: thiol:disulfide interchange protein DsbC [Gammaproteobacteria bacterium]|jgi:thiol:disulfide interchange protein DsbC
MNIRYTGSTTNILIGLALAIISSSVQAEGRWYDDAVLQRGTDLFAENCSACHGNNAEGTLDWKKTDSNGNYPPPPLNGTAHAWHHSIEVLHETIQDGGIKLGGVMPSFKGKLSDQDIDAVIAYFQSKWPEKLYRKWAENYKVSNAPGVEPVDDKPDETSSLGNNKMTALLESRLGENKFTDPTKTPLKGIYQTQIGKDFGYLTENGRYLIMGNLIDLEQGQNLTQIHKRKMIKSEIDQIGIKDKAVFPAVGEEKAILNVFTDTSCPYCTKLHKEVKKLQDAGISVHYIPYPRGGKQGPGYQKLKQVWCAEDKATALTIGKGLASGKLPAGNCEKSILVDQGYAQGNKVGVTGTPALFKSSGEMITGYVPYDRLIPMVLNNE